MDLIINKKGESYLNALIKKYEAELDMAKAHMGTYFNDGVGVGEHSEISDEIDKWIQKGIDAEDKLNFLRKHCKLMM